VLSEALRANMIANMDSQSANMHAIFDYISMMSTELLFLVFFGLGFLALQSSTQKSVKSKKKSKGIDAHVDRWKTIEIEAQAGHVEGVLATWRSARTVPTPADTLKFVTHAFLEASKDTMCDELVAHIKAHQATLANVRSTSSILDVVARAGEIELMEKLWSIFREEMQITPNLHMYDVMLGGYAAAGKELKVQDTMNAMMGESLKVSARGFSLSIKGFLKNNMADAALRQIHAMKEVGFFVPPFAVAQVFRVAGDAGRTEEFMNKLEALDVPLPAEGVTLLLDECCKQSKLELAQRVEAWGRRSDVPVSSGAYDGLLKLYASQGDINGIKLFEEMTAAGNRFSEGLCVGLLARCADSKFLRFAERIVRYVKEKQGMTIAMYSALMKVYAFCGMFARACDLYEELTQEGLQPDAMMYGCLMKFAVDCGRTSLAQQLFDKAPRLEIQNYMSLIRAAGRDGDVDRAFAILKKLQDSDVSSDLAAYNCVLDVCVSMGKIDRARELITQMKKGRSLDVITWNTLLKGYCNKGDLAGARGVIKEMEQDGHAPNDISFNCLINAAVSSGSFSEAWETITMMEKSGVKVDHYTVSIMMKSLKKVKAPRDVARALALLDRSNLDVYSDEVLLNTVVETCVRHKENKRLQVIVDGFASSSLTPSVHTYGTLIKACSILKRLKQCWDLWYDMVTVRNLHPNDITMGCMLDALVCNNHVEDAVQLLNEWKGRVQTNAVMYSTVIKGFATLRQADRALELWREMRESGGLMNTVIYNVVIDAQARVGSMDAVSMLVKCMCQDGCVPDAITNSTIVKGYCIKGDLDRGLEVFRHMQAEGMVKDAIIYNTLLDGCARHGRINIAEDLLKDMEDHKISPSNFTLGILVKLYGRRGKLDFAFEAVQVWPKKYGIVANAQVWTALMCAYINDSDMDRAMKTFEQMKQSGLSPDGKAYGALINGCIRMGHVQAAVTVLEEAYGLNEGATRGLPDDQGIEVENLESLVKAVSNKKGKPACIALLQRLAAAHVPLSDKVRSYGR